VGWLLSNEREERSRFLTGLSDRFGMTTVEQKSGSRTKEKHEKPEVLAKS
jgi:hypothetical protein